MEDFRRIDNRFGSLGREENLNQTNIFQMIKSISFLLS
jgi:hypothetical protein